MSDNSSQDEELFQVVFAGIITGDYSMEQTKRRFGKVFKLTPPRVERIFSGREFTLKKNMTEDKAMDFAVKLAEIGCETYIEHMPVAGQENFEERRKTIRRIRFRRGPRPGAIVPDRRLLPSRRKADLEALEKNGDFPGNTVGPDQ